MSINYAAATSCFNAFDHNIERLRTTYFKTCFGSEITATFQVFKCHVTFLKQACLASYSTMDKISIQKNITTISKLEDFVQLKITWCYRFILKLRIFYYLYFVLHRHLQYYFHSDLQIMSWKS